MSSKLRDCSQPRYRDLGEGVVECGEGVPGGRDDRERVAELAEVGSFSADGPVQFGRELTGSVPGPSTTWRHTKSIGYRALYGGRRAQPSALDEGRRSSRGGLAVRHIQHLERPQPLVALMSAPTATGAARQRHPQLVKETAARGRFPLRE